MIPTVPRYFGTHLIEAGRGNIAAFFRSELAQKFLRRLRTIGARTSRRGHQRTAIVTPNFSAEGTSKGIGARFGGRRHGGTL
jgi:hypothetical protein